MALWGSAFPSSRWAVGEVPHTVAALLRFGGGAVVLVLVLLVWRPERMLRPADIARACLAGLVGVFAYNALFFWGVTMAPASDGSVLLPALVPVITTTVLVLGKRESASPARILGLALGAGGAVLFLVATGAEADSRRLLGDAVFAAGAAVWAAYTLLNRRLLGGMDPVQTVTFGMVAGAVALAGMAVPDLGTVHWGQLSAGFWLNTVYLAAGPTALAYLLYVRGIRDVGAATTSAMMFAVPVFGTAASFLLLGERFTLAQAGAAAIMLGGAYLAVVRGAQAPRRKPAIRDSGPIKASPR